MIAARVAGLIGRDCLSTAISPRDYDVLRLLQKGCAYQMRGAWRFRGVHHHVKERALVSLLEKGLAERVENDRHRQVRITSTGREANRKRPRLEENPA
jgi:predicted transcriptional regulator